MSAEAGFGMVELLVALAICAVLVMGAGSLISLGHQLRDRAEMAEQVQQAILDLRALGSVLGGGTWVGLGDVRPRTFGLCHSGLGEGARLIGTFSLLSDRASYRTASAVSEADLSVFDTSSLEYLVSTPTQQDWRPADALAGMRPVAARLLLSLGTRKWRTLLWMERRKPEATLKGTLTCGA
jgi:prepilin-type N-terminal cleavage/methylation domain-containing protein